jgi:hypothetical protein
MLFKQVDVGLHNGVHNILVGIHNLHKSLQSYLGGIVGGARARVFNAPTVVTVQQQLDCSATQNEK